MGYPEFSTHILRNLIIQVKWADHIEHNKKNHVNPPRSSNTFLYPIALKTFEICKIKYFIKIHGISDRYITKSYRLKQED